MTKKTSLGVPIVVRFFFVLSENASGSSELGRTLQKNGPFFFRVLGVPSSAEPSRKMVLFFRVLGVPSSAEPSRKIVFFWESEKQ